MLAEASGLKTEASGNLGIRDEHGSVDRPGITPQQLMALRQLAEELAADVGRLRCVRDRAHLVDRLANVAWRLDGFTSPTAADLYRETGDVEWALEVVDDHARRFGRLLGEAVER